MSQAPVTFGQVLRGIRKKMGMSQEKLSKISGISKAEISQIERSYHVPTRKAVCENLRKALRISENAFYSMRDNARTIYIANRDTLEQVESVAGIYPFCRASHTRLQELTQAYPQLMDDMLEKVKEYEAT